MYFVIRCSYIVLLALLLGCPATGFGQDGPEDYSAKIETATTHIYSLASLWGATFVDQYNGAQDYGKLSPTRKDLQNYIDKKLKEFKKATDISGSQPLNTALIAFLEYEKGLVESGFEPFEKLTATASEEQVYACREHLKEQASKEAAYTTALNAARKEYARKNGFSLLPPADDKPPIRKPMVVKPVTTQPARQQPAAISEPVNKEKTGKEKDKDEDDKDEE